MTYFSHQHLSARETAHHSASLQGHFRVDHLRDKLITCSIFALESAQLGLRMKELFLTISPDALLAWWTCFLATDDWW